MIGLTSSANASKTASAPSLPTAAKPRLERLDGAIVARLRSTRLTRCPNRDANPFTTVLGAFPERFCATISETSIAPPVQGPCWTPCVRLAAGPLQRFQRTAVKGRWVVRRKAVILGDCCAMGSTQGRDPRRPAGSGGSRRIAGRRVRGQAGPPQQDRVPVIR